MGKAQEVKVEVQINVLHLNSFIEFKIESDSKGEMATGHIRKLGVYSFEFFMGPKTSDNYINNIWFWWDTLDGTAELTVWVNDVKVLETVCSNKGYGEKHPVKVATEVKLFKSTRSPRLIDDPNYPMTNLQIWFD